MIMDSYIIRMMSVEHTISHTYLSSRGVVLSNPKLCCSQLIRNQDAAGLNYQLLKLQDNNTYFLKCRM